jgi:hypothetical protein
LVIRHIFRTCARWRNFMHIYFRYGFNLVFIVYVFMMHWKNKCTKMCHNCRKRIHKWHKTKTKYNQMFMIIEIIEESLGWRTFIHRGYVLFVLLYFFFWPLCYLFFDLRILITPLVSSNSSWNRLRHSRLIIFFNLFYQANFQNRK